MKKFLVSFAMIMASIVTMAQSQFYVILKDGTGASFPESTVDSLTFEDSNGAKIYGFETLANSIAQLRREVDSLKLIIANGVISEGDDFKHEYVDLELPSGLLWATTNIGAKKPGEIGNFFAFGVTTPQENYSASSYKYNGYEKSDFITAKVIDDNYNLTEYNDPATKNWGEEWKTPSSKDFEELMNYCVWQWSEKDGTSCIMFTSKKNGKSIYLPCGGYYKNDEIIAGGYRGYYTTSTMGYSSISNTLYTHQEGVFLSTMVNSNGKNVRPVKRETNDNRVHNNSDSLIQGHKYVDLGLPSGNLWATKNIYALKTEYEGSRFAWGEIGLREETEFTEENAKWKGLTEDELIEKKVITPWKNLTSENDAATKHMGDYWKIPTKDDYVELIKNCKSTIIEYGDKKAKCVKFTSENGNELIFPIVDGYWTATPFGSDGAEMFSYMSDTGVLVMATSRYNGLCVRGIVRKE